MIPDAERSELLAIARHASRRFARSCRSRAGTPRQGTWLDRTRVHSSVSTAWASCADASATWRPIRPLADVVAVVRGVRGDRRSAIPAGDSPGTRRGSRSSCRCWAASSRFTRSPTSRSAATDCWSKRDGAAVCCSRRSRPSGAGMSGVRGAHLPEGRPSTGRLAVRRRDAVRFEAEVFSEDTRR